MKEPEDLIALLKGNMGWGRLNSGAAVRADFCCEYCGVCLLDSVILYYSWEIDHIIPCGGDDLENVALACRTCNHLKHGHVPKGATRQDRIIDATNIIRDGRQKKAAELAKIRDLVAEWRDMSVAQSAGDDVLISSHK